MSDKGAENGNRGNPVTVDAMEEDEDDLIDDEQLGEYREMVENLGTFPVSMQESFVNEDFSGCCCALDPDLLRFP